MRNFLTALFLIFLLLPMRVMADDDRAAAGAAPGPVTASMEISAQ